MSNWGHILDEITVERKNQIAKWGDNKPPIDTMLRVIGEEFGEACQAINDGDHYGYRQELIQVAACCVKAVEAFDAGVTTGPDQKEVEALKKEIKRLEDIIRNVRTEVS